MTRKQIDALKTRILALHWASNLERAQANNLTLDLPEKHRRFTKRDYQRFFKECGVKHKWR